MRFELRARCNCIFRPTGQRSTDIRKEWRRTRIRNPRSRTQKLRQLRTRMFQRSYMGGDDHDTSARSTRRKSGHLKEQGKKGGLRGPFGTSTLGTALTPAGPCVESGGAKDFVQTPLERCVCLQVRRPRRHGLERVAHRIRDGAWVRWNHRVDLVVWRRSTRQLLVMVVNAAD
jgi:hypothetical protein